MIGAVEVELPGMPARGSQVDDCVRYLALRVGMKRAGWLVGFALVWRASGSSVGGLRAWGWSRSSAFRAQADWRAVFGRMSPDEWLATVGL